MTDEDQLERLRLIDVDTYNRFYRNDCFQRDDFRRDATLQAVLQDAIRARKWCYWIGKTELTTFAHIDRKGAASKGPDSIERRADNEVESLLLAYLAAAEP
jgi:hypothetical protein